MPEVSHPPGAWGHPLRVPASAETLSVDGVDQGIYAASLRKTFPVAMLVEITSEILHERNLQ